MKKGLVIIGVLLLLLVAALICFTPRPPASASLIRVLGTVTNNSQRYVILNITNSTHGLAAWNPNRMIFVTQKDEIITPLWMRSKNLIGFDGLLKPATDCTFTVPIPEGAIRWKVDFNVTFQTPFTRARDAFRNWRLARQSDFYKNMPSLGSPKRVTTGELPP